MPSYTAGRVLGSYPSLLCPNSHGRPARRAWWTMWTRADGRSVGNAGLFCSTELEARLLARGLCGEWLSAQTGVIARSTRTPLAPRARGHAARCRALPPRSSWGAATRTSSRGPIALHHTVPFSGGALLPTIGCDALVMCLHITLTRVCGRWVARACSTDMVAIR